MPDVIIITSPGPPGPPGPPGSGSSGGGVGFPFSGSAIITGSLEILSSGSNNILTLTSQSNTLFQITNNTTGNLLEVNSFLNPFDLPIFYVSSSYQSEFRGPVLGSFTGSLLGTASYTTQALSSSFATTASFALNAGTTINTSSFVQNSQTGSFITTASVDLNTITFTKGNGTTFPILINTGSGGGGSSFPYTGSAGISGSLDLNGPLNVDIQNFNILNDIFNPTQTSSISETTINIQTKSNKLDNINSFNSIGFDDGWGVSPSITSGSLFYISLVLNSGGGNYNHLTGSRVFFTGSTDVFGVPGFKYIGNVINWNEDRSIDYDDYYITCSAVTTATLIPNSGFRDINNFFRFYPATSSGIINLEGYITASKGLLVNGSTYINNNITISGSAIISGSTNISGSTTITGSLNTLGSINVQGQVSASNYIGSGIGLTGILTNPFFANLVVNGNITATGSLNSNGSNQLNIGTINYSSKTITLGQPVLDENQFANDTNYFQLYKKLGSPTTHTIFNFGSDDYWCDSENCSLSDNFGNNYLEFIQSIQSLGQFPQNLSNTPIIDIKFNTTPYGYNGSTYLSGSSKGFSTNYQGSTYFNVTGSVSASAYFGNGSTLSGVVTNPFTGSLLATGSINLIGILSSSIANLDTINSTNGINGVYISEGSGSRPTNLVIGDTRALATISGTGVSGQNNIAIGSGSLIAATGTYRNIALGNNVMPLVTSNGSNNNIGIGFDVLTSGTTGLVNNIAVGNSASYAAVSGDNNIAIGTEALFSNPNQSNNIAIGLRAGKLATGAASSIFIGVDAGANVTSGDNNIAIGFEALKLLTSVGNNIAIGYQAMVSGSGAQDSIAIGSSALRNITTGDDNLAIGANALATITTAAGNLVIGTDSMISSSATLASNNTSIGFQSLQQITGSNNVALGYRTMQSFRSGSNNTVIGYNNISGSGVSGSNNTIIGANVVLPAGVHNNRIIIADGRGTQIINTSGSITSISGSLNVTGSSAIFTLQPQDPLPTVNIPTGSFAVSSSIPAKPYFWDGSVWNALY
jgi:hypothetical protein